jgi:hypothetical protein
MFVSNVQDSLVLLLIIGEIIALYDSKNLHASSSSVISPWQDKPNKMHIDTRQHDSLEIILQQNMIPTSPCNCSVEMETLLILLVLSKVK